MGKIINNHNQEVYRFPVLCPLEIEQLIQGTFPIRRCLAEGALY